MNSVTLPRRRIQFNSLLLFCYQSLESPLFKSNLGIYHGLLFHHQKNLDHIHFASDGRQQLNLQNICQF